MAALGQPNIHSPIKMEKRPSSLKEKLASVSPLVEDLSNVSINFILALLFYNYFSYLLTTVYIVLIDGLFHVLGRFLIQMSRSVKISLMKSGKNWLVGSLNML